MRYEEINTYSSNIVLGRSGENNIKTITFNISALIDELGDGTAVLLHKRPGDASAYPVSAELGEDGTLSWTVSSTDTAVSGKGRCEVQYIADDGTIAKSGQWTTVIYESLGDSDEETPSPETGWVAQMLESIQELLDAHTAEIQEMIDAALESISGSSSEDTDSTDATDDVVDSD